MKKPFVFNEKGFLLLEHLISIAIMAVLSIAFLYLMRVISVYTVDQTALTMHEANTLAIRLQNEVRLADSLSVVDGRLLAHFVSEDNVVSFAVQNNNLVRQVNGRGGEILVYNLFGISVFLFDAQSARVSLRSFDGDVFQFYLQVLQIEVNLPEIDDDDDEEEIDDEDNEE